MEWPKIYRELMTWFTPLPLPQAQYPAPAREKTRQACCGGRQYFCRHCPKTFDKAFNWMRHVEKVNDKK